MRASSSSSEGEASRKERLGGIAVGMRGEVLMVWREWRNEGDILGIKVAFLWVLVEVTR